MTADKDALLREALEWLPKEGFDDNLPELRSLRARITAALEDGVTNKNNGNNEPYWAGMAEYQDPPPQGDEK